jgi:hypothetical protein
VEAHARQTEDVGHAAVGTREREAIRMPVRRRGGWWIVVLVGLGLVAAAVALAVKASR